jgi:hypothetical protein
VAHHPDELDDAAIDGHDPPRHDSSRRMIEAAAPSRSATEPFMRSLIRRQRSSSS